MEYPIEAKFFELSELLYNNDPAGTCCVENEMSDEYDAEVIKKIFPTIKHIVLS